MLKHIILFVLVILMVKTNAQTVVNFNYNGNTISLNETDDKLLIRLLDETDEDMRDQLIDKINNDPDYSLLSSNGRYYLLQKNISSTISKTQAINYYINESYIGYVSFLFDMGDNNYGGITHEILVRATGSVSETDIQNIANPYGLLTLEQYEFDEHVYHLYFSKTTNILGILDNLFQSGLFEYVAPNYFISLNKLFGSSQTCSTPSNVDPLMPDQWALYNNGSTPYGGNAWSDINICNAWNGTDGGGNSFTADGSNIVVAVIDDGVYTLHPDLNILKNSGGAVIGYDPVATSLASYPPIHTDPGSPDQYSFHGTRCAGIIAAKQNNTYLGSNYGISGVAYNAKIMPIRSWWITPTGYSTDIVALGKSFDFARTNNADVISNSWGYCPGCPVMYAPMLETAINNAVANGRSGKGCVVVFATGNDDQSNIMWPSSNPNVIAVGGSSMCDERKSPSSCDGQTIWGSNYGLGQSMSLYPWLNTSGYLSVVAPCVQVMTTEFHWLIGGGYTPGFDEMDGTSAAAPHVAGTAALMLSQNPCLTQTEVRAIIEQTADKVGGYSYAITSGINNGTWNAEMGHGRLNTGNAVTRAHDMYRQDQTEAAAKVYSSYHKIFAGNDVDPTQTIPVGDYIVNNGANILFNAPEEINLKPGFEAAGGASGTLTFHAKITSPTPCTTSHSHYKKGDGTDRSNLTSGLNNNIKSGDIKVYPNPVHNDLNIAFLCKREGRVSWAISNILGQQVMASEPESVMPGKYERIVSTGSLSPGIYIITVRTGDGQKQFKFSKE